MANINKLKCPSCGLSLEGLKRSVAEEYLKRFQKYKQGFEDQLLEEEKKHRLEIRYLREGLQIEYKNLCKPSDKSRRQ
jgi:hypothetical protein